MYTSLLLNDNLRRCCVLVCCLSYLVVGILDRIQRIKYRMINNPTSALSIIRSLLQRKIIQMTVANGIKNKHRYCQWLLQQVILLNSKLNASVSFSNYFPFGVVL